MRYKLIALDIDGTIRSREHGISERTRLAVHAAREAGAMVTVVTGRMFPAALEATRGLDLQSPIATYQGAHVAHPLTREVYWHRPLCEGMTLAALEALEGRGYEVLAHLRNEVYVDELTAWGEAYVERNGVEVHRVGDLRELASEGVTRLVVGGEDERIAQVTVHLQRRLGSRLQITRSLPHFCEALHPDTGKALALRRVCEALGAGREQTAAFGNGDEDAPMIAWAGLGVAVAGGGEAAVRAADVVAPPLEEDGVAQVIERLLLDG